MKRYPALDILDADIDLLLADLDEHGPTAIEERPGGIRAFFTTAAARDAAARALGGGRRVEPIEVSDEDWARCSQEHLTAVTVGRITVTPPWLAAEPNGLVIVINPSMGFGTGHHPTTRLCLDALQQLDLAGQAVLDVGTGSGVLALAARLLGADPVVGVDNDPDAIASAAENLMLNRAASGVRFLTGDFGAVMSTGTPANVAVANLTGAVLVREARALSACVRPGGRLIVSGLLDSERAGVVGAYPGWTLERERQEEGWVALVLRSPARV